MELKKNGKLVRKTEEHLPAWDGIQSVSEKPRQPWWVRALESLLKAVDKQDVLPLAMIGTAAYLEAMAVSGVFLPTVVVSAGVAIAMRKQEQYARQKNPNSDGHDPESGLAS